MGFHPIPRILTNHKPFNLFVQNMVEYQMIRKYLGSGAKPQLKEIFSATLPLRFSALNKIPCTGEDDSRVLGVWGKTTAQKNLLCYSASPLLCVKNFVFFVFFTAKHQQLLCVLCGWKYNISFLALIVYVNSPGASNLHDRHIPFSNFPNSTAYSNSIPSHFSSLSST